MYFFKHIKYYLIKIKKHIKYYGIKSTIYIGFNLLKQKIFYDFSRQYKKWIKEKESNYLDFLKNKKINFKYMPLISIITPVYNINIDVFKMTVMSVMEQLYDNWELCIVDDASDDEKLKEYIVDLHRRYPDKIKVKLLKKNVHISGASNNAIKLSKGKYIAFLDHDDMLAPNALYEVVTELNKNKSIDIFYSDEDKIDIKNKRSGPYFKPDWSPELILSHNYMTHFLVVRSSLIKKVNGFRIGYEGAQDWDLILRITDLTDKIFHIPKILYHWRIIESSVTFSSNVKEYAYVAGKKAIEDKLKRNKLKGKVLDVLTPGHFRVRYDISKEKLVSIIILNKNHSDMLINCLDSIIKHTVYNKYEIIIIDNNSNNYHKNTIMKYIKNKTFIRMYDYNKSFNYSKMNNWAVELAKGEYVLFLNNDIEVISNDWLTAMVEFFSVRKISVVGAKLLYKDKIIQHAGIVTGIGYIAGHIFRGETYISNGYANWLSLIRNYSAVTGACMLTRKTLFQKLKGFNEEELAVAYNDVDYCLRVWDAGYRVVYTPYAVLYHFESQSRGYSYEGGKIKDEGEIRYMRGKWGDRLKKDPFFNPNFSLKSEKIMLDVI